MSKINELAKLGQSIWFDYIRRSLITSGELKDLVDQGLGGVTSNPTIFEQAIVGSNDYDSAMKRLIEEDKSVQEIYEALAVDDIAATADILDPVYQSTRGRDGFVSLEVNPQLAHDTEKTVAEAKRLYETVKRPNVMIKVPATPAGVPAIQQLIAAGVSVNVTLIFSIESYRQIAAAYLSGLEMLSEKGPSVSGGHAVNSIASVASFFVSRVDTAVDKALEKSGNKSLQGKIAIDNAKIAYAEFGRIFSGPRWENLAAQGAGVQRVLWASTGTKNALYPDTLYVDELIGTDTVNTLPPATLDAFVDHGVVEETLSVGLDEAEARVGELAEYGIDLDTITSKLQEDGVASFARSFEMLMEGIAAKKNRLQLLKKSYRASLKQHQTAVDKALQAIKDNRIISRIWAHDHTVWKPDPTEVGNRLGWLDSPNVMTDAVPQINDFTAEVRAAGYTHALLLGMGGSSLAPEVFRLTFGVKEGYLDLAVLDSTHPGAVRAMAARSDPDRTLYIVSTKSGGTVETFSFMKYFYNATLAAVGPDKVGEHFIAITDPGSGLENAAKELKFRKIFLNDPNIGGRYSALSYFGLVPAALIGMDLTRILERAAAMAENAKDYNCPVEGDNTAAWLGATVGELALNGQDKVTLITSPQLVYFGAWAEQLIAESTGKEGKGILPVAGETVVSPEQYGNDRLFVCLRLNGDDTFDAGVQALEEDGRPVIHIKLTDLYDLCGEFFRWEMATVIAGMRIRINPFDQPDVESAKVLAREMVAAYQKEGRLPSLVPTLNTDSVRIYADIQADSPRDALQKFLAQASTGKQTEADRSYVALQAFVEPTPETDAALQHLRTAIQQRYGLAVTVGFGPRFLHSTGQLHKGDAGHGLFIQITEQIESDLPIPDQPGSSAASMDFGILIRAQALGDRQALLNANRKVIRFHFERNTADELKKLTEAF
jgi:transaldolase/glucose-6-phosphate isomerase